MNRSHRRPQQYREVLGAPLSSLDRDWPSVPFASIWTPVAVCRGSGRLCPVMVRERCKGVCVYALPAREEAKA